MMKESRQCETSPPRALRSPQACSEALLDVLLDSFLNVLTNALLGVVLCTAKAIADEDDTAIGSVVGLREVDNVDVVHGLAMQSRCAWACPLHGAPPSLGACPMSRVRL